MIAMDAVTNNMKTSDTCTGGPLLSASLASLAFVAGHLGAGLGWHGSIALGSATSGERDQLLETCS
jgi:hypothetical protein